MASPQIGQREVVYENSYQQVYKVAVNFGSFTKQYFVTDYGQRVGIVVAKAECVLLVRQFRLLIDQVSWEIPGGKVDDGETPEKAAVRECLEETGIHCLNLKPLLNFHPGLDTLYNPTHLFYARKFVEMKSNHVHTQEVRQHVWLPLTGCLKMVFEQQIVDSLSIVALLAYRTFVQGR